MRPLLILPLLLTISAVAVSAGYDPLELGAPGATIELTVTDAKRDRSIPLRVYLPASAQAAPVVVFSHGLGGSKEGSAFLGKHWSARGYVAVFLQHPGSDTDVWKEAAPGARLQKLKAAGSFQNFLLRVQDVPAVLDQLTAWNSDPAHPLASRLDLDHVGMSGHSFGAITTQAVSGQSAGAMGPRFTDSRIKAALPMSQSPPNIGSPADAFGSVKIPWMLMTGTKDDAMIAANLTPERRALVFPALPPGRKYELILHNAEHSAFTERPLPGDKEPRNPNHHRAILALSTAFWDAYLKEDPAAKAWLDSEAPRSVLEELDSWRRK
jgi:predicted dienelactone hydrolase